MTVDEMIAKFKSADNDIPYKDKNKRDIDGFIRLYELGIVDGDILACAEHDEVYLSVDIEKLASVANDEDIELLVKSSIHIDESTSSLYMFV